MSDDIKRNTFSNSDDTTIAIDITGFSTNVLTHFLFALRKAQDECDGMRDFWERDRPEIAAHPQVVTSISNIHKELDRQRGEVMKRYNDDGSPIMPPAQHVAAGTCGKCGAPYYMYTGPWMGIIPPYPTPSCNCWNRTTINTATTYPPTEDK